MSETVHLVGRAEIALVDKATGALVQSVRVKNQMTEPFARWLLAGNLASSEIACRASEWEENPISRLLYSHPYLKETPPTTENRNLRQGYQIIRTDSSEGMFRMYLLSKPVSITAQTVFPPYFDASLQKEDSRSWNNTPLVTFCGDADDLDDQDSALVLSHELSGWSPVRSNPAFTSVYIHSGGAGTIRSVVLGAPPVQEDGTPGAYLSVRQSPTQLPEGWDTAWQPRWEDSASRALTPNAPSGLYLIAPFLRSSLRDGLYGTGFYGVGATDGMISFYDFGSGLFENNKEANAQKTNGLTGETYTTMADNFVSPKVAGGFALGSGKAIRVGKGSEVWDSAGRCLGRTAVIHYQETLASPSEPMTQYVETPVLYATEGSIIPETIYKNCAPVMVAKRGSTAEKDVVEIFISLGIGTFTPYTDDAGDHPGGTGVEIHKISLFIQNYRQTAENLTALLEENPTTFLNHGRVAVLPFALGWLPQYRDEGIDSATTGEDYVSGSFDEAQDVYYLPVTHLLSGVSPLTWEFDAAEENALTPVLCASDTFTPGVKLERIDFEFLHACLLGINDQKWAYAVTTDGYQPLAVNQRQRWATCATQVLSALNLPEPIHKTERQRLVVRYTYAFEVYPEVE